MSSVADIPSEARCKQLVYELATKQKHHECGQRIAWRYGRDYGWCRACRMKIRPKARTWFGRWSISEIVCKENYFIIHFYNPENIGIFYTCTIRIF